MSITAIVIVAVVVAMFTLAVALSVSKDKYEQGYEDGLHSRLAQLAKQRYHKETDCVLFVVPRDEYDSEIDQIT